MIKVYVGKNQIHVQGHANTAPKGQDIVCAAVSALTLTLIRGLTEICHTKIYKKVEPGDVQIAWKEITHEGEALIDTWFLGMYSIADSYENVDIFDDDSGHSG